jgi:hypothetical protein
MVSQILPATSGPQSRAIAQMPVGEVTLLTFDRIVGLSLLIDRHVRAMRDGEAFTPGYQH